MRRNDIDPAFFTTRRTTDILRSEGTDLEAQNKVLHGIILNNLYNSPFYIEYPDDAAADRTEYIQRISNGENGESYYNIIKWENDITRIYFRRSSNPDAQPEKGTGFVLGLGSYDAGSRSYKWGEYKVYLTKDNKIREAAGDVCYEIIRNDIAGSWCIKLFGKLLDHDSVATLGESTSSTVTLPSPSISTEELEEIFADVISMEVGNEWLQTKGGHWYGSDIMQWIHDNGTSPSTRERQDVSSISRVKQMFNDFIRSKLDSAATEVRLAELAPYLTCSRSGEVMRNPRFCKSDGKFYDLSSVPEKSKHDLVKPIPLAQLLTRYHEIMAEYIDKLKGAMPVSHARAHREETVEVSSAALGELYHLIKSVITDSRWGVYPANRRAMLAVLKIDSFPTLETKIKALQDCYTNTRDGFFYGRVTTGQLERLYSTIKKIHLSSADSVVHACSELRDILSDIPLDEPIEFSMGAGG